MLLISLPFSSFFQFTIKFASLIVLIFMKFGALPKFYEFACQHLQVAWYDSITAWTRSLVYFHTNAPPFLVFFVVNKF